MMNEQDAMNQDRAESVLSAVLADEQAFDCEHFARVCGVSREWLAVHVRAGILSTGGEEPANWMFSGTEIRRVRLIHALERDFNALPELAALVIDLQDEVARLRALLRRGG